MEYKLPDFDEMLGIADQVGELTTSIAIHKAELEDLLADVTYKVMNDEKYWGGKTKQPAMNFIMATYHRHGYDEESKKKLRELRVEIAEKTGEAGKLRMVFGVYRDQVDVWKADQYSKRDSQY